LRLSPSIDPRTRSLGAAVGRVLHGAIATLGAVDCHEVNINAALEADPRVFSAISASYSSGGEFMRSRAGKVQLIYGPQVQRVS
jgi:hypothetical protein